jgi:sec-independent protein translocase protein TatA
MFNIFRNISGGEIIIVAVLALFFFGGKKLSEFTKGLRQSKEEFDKIKKDLENPLDTEKNSEENNTNSPNQ